MRELTPILSLKEETALNSNAEYVKSNKSDKCKEEVDNNSKINKFYN
jgi:hypothetical protein